MTDTDKLLQMSLLLKALDDLEQMKIEFMADHKAGKEKLLGELSKMRYEILSGQEKLPLEPVA